MQSGLLSSAQYGNNSLFGLGVQNVTYFALDGSGNNSTCTFTVTVKDREAPVLTCPSSISTSTAPGVCRAVVNYTAPSVSDNCGAVSAMLVTGQYSNTNFSHGTTVVLYNATDGSDNVGTCSFTVTVVDTESPKITCPTNIAVHTLAGVCYSNVSYSTPSTSDNCAVSSSSVAPLLRSGQNFTLGAHTVNWTVVDTSSLSSWCAFTVQVSDVEPPRVTCPANLLIDTIPSTCHARATFGSFSVSDNCGVSQSGLSSNMLYSNNSFFGLGNRTVSYWAQDTSGNNASCSFTVAVVDQEPPRITCPSNISVGTDSGVCVALVNYSIPTYSDNCAASLSMTSGQNPLTNFSHGATVVDYQAVDTSGNVATCSFIVQVVDTQAPTVLCPADIAVTAISGQCQQNVTYSAPVAADNCAVQSVVRVAGLASGSMFPVGNTTVTFNATDTSGLSSLCSFVVRVRDTQAPVLAGCPSNIVADADIGLCTHNVTYVAPTLSDNCPGPISVRTGPASGSALHVGEYGILYTATDASGNSATCSFNITVKDTQVPTITCPANISTVMSSMYCSATVAYNATTSHDNCPGYNTVRVAGLASGSSFARGTTEVIYTVTDASGNAANCSFSVTVVDTTLPVISGCPSSQTLFTDTGYCYANLTYTVPTVTDSCGASISLVEGLPSGGSFPQGSPTLVSYKAIDVAGLVAFCNFTVTVDDFQSPIITCPADISVNNTRGYCGANVTFITPVGTDNCPNPITFPSIGTLSSGSFFPVGSTTETYNVRKGHVPALTTWCTFLINVSDVEAPQITCPSAISQNTDAGVCYAIVSYTAPVGVDNCAGAYTSGPSSPGNFSLGSNGVSYTVHDAVGLTSSCNLSVTIHDAEAPKITCPASLDVLAINGCETQVNYTLPVISDNCAVSMLTLVSGPPSGTNMSVGNRTIVYSVNDTSGNVASCSFYIVVHDGNQPTISCPSDIVVNTSATTCNATVSFAPPVGQQRCSASTTVQNHGLTSGSVFDAAIVTEEGFTVTDILGRTASCSFNVSVDDVFAPHVTCPSNINAYTATGTCHATVNYSSATYTDNCNAYVNLSRSGGLASGADFPLGSTTVSYLARDGLGAHFSSSCSFSVTVLDHEPPTITCPSNISVGAAPGACHAAVSFSISTHDNCGVFNVSQLQGLGNGSIFPVGETLQEFKVTDTSGNEARCSFVVVVVDNQNPTIVCPSSISTTTSAGLCGRAVTYASPTATDNCGVNRTILVSGNSSGSVFGVGVTTVSYGATDVHGNTATCSFTVTVADHVAPLVTCPPSRAVGMDVNVCDAVVNYSQPTTYDSCPGVTLTLQGLASGDVFPPGASTVFYTAQGEGGIAVCSFTVTVQDRQHPNITCPASINTVTNPGVCTSVVTYVTPVGWDNCNQTTTLVAGGNNGSAFGLGLTNVTYLTTDTSGLTSDCTFTVLVRDIEAPRITCPSNVTVNNTPLMCAANVTYAAPSTQDNCVTVTTARIGTASGGSFPVGGSLVSYTVTDGSHNNASCSFAVTVNDDERPRITCPNSIVTGTDAHVCSAVVTYSAPVGVDNCPGAHTNQTAGYGSGHNYSLGQTTNTFLVVDSAGLQAQCSFTIRVNDTEAPVITCPNDIVLPADAGACSAVITYNMAAATDNCAVTFMNVTGGPTNGTQIHVGNYTVQFTAWDAAGNFARCDFKVSVVDLQAPLLTCPGNLSASTPTTACGANVSFTAPSAVDNCGAVAVAQTSGLRGLLFPVGSSHLTFVATDGAGNQASCAFNVEVNDVVVPEISCPVNITVTRNNLLYCNASVSFVAPVGTDNCNSTTVRTRGLDSNSTFNLGSTVEQFTVTDASGNSASCLFVVKVLDLTPPTIVCPTVNTSYNSQPGLCGAHVTYSPPLTHDNCQVATTGSLSALGSGSIFPVGNTTEIYDVEDEAGNNATCSFIVRVLDVEAPKITCPSPITHNNDPGVCNAVVSFTVPVGTDNCAGQTTALTSGLGSGQVFNVGVHTEVYTVTDLASLHANCSFTITVVDAEPPNITCPSSVIVPAESGLCSAAVTYGAVTASDNCRSVNISLLTASAVNGSRFNVGVTNVTFQAQDAVGLTSICTFTVTVQDTQPPIITCPGPQTYSTDLNVCGANVTYSIGHTDNCGSSTIQLTGGQSSLSIFGVGRTEVSYVARDLVGNTASCAFNVTVTDNQRPAISCPTNITQHTDAGVCYATVLYTTPVGTDNCPSPNTTRTAGLASSSHFPLGVNVVSYIVEDAYGNSQQCSFYVHVTDLEAPVLSRFSSPPPPFLPIVYFKYF